MPDDSLFGKEKDFIFLKSRFYNDDKGVYGLFYILFEPATKNYEKMDIMATHFKTYINNVIPEGNWEACDWSILEDIINAAKFKGEFNDLITKDMQHAIVKILNSAEIEYITSMIIKKEIDELRKMFNDIFRKTLGESSVHFDFTFENVTSKDIENKIKMKEEAISLEKKEMDEKEAQYNKVKQQLPENSAIIDVSFVLSPVSGITMDELKTGQKIMVRIDLKSTKGKYFASLLEVEKEGVCKPIPATITKITKSPHDEIFFLVKIQEGIFGRIIETEPVKVRLFDPSKDKDLQKTVSMDKSGQNSSSDSTLDKQIESESNLLLYIIISTGIILLIIIIYLYMFSN